MKYRYWRVNYGADTTVSPPVAAALVRANYVEQAAQEVAA
jgi:hypothetical protein